MPSKPAMAAAVDIIQDADGLDCIIIDSEQLAMAECIDAHFRPYLAAVEAARRLLGRVDSMTTAEFSRSGEKAERESLRHALAEIDSPHNAATLAPGDQG